MVNKIVSNILELINNPRVLFISYFSDNMTKSEMLVDIEELEKKLSSILEDIQEYKKELNK